MGGKPNAVSSGSAVRRAFYLVWTPDRVEHHNNSGEERDRLPDRWMAVVHPIPTILASERSCWLAAMAPKSGVWRKVVSEYQPEGDVQGDADCDHDEG